MPSAPDIVVLSHLRWDFVFQRPQHLLTRFARARRVFYVEEPVETVDAPHLRISNRDAGLTIVTPQLPSDLTQVAAEEIQQLLLAGLLRRSQIVQPVLWFYTPMALPLTERLEAAAVVYDCMDELTLFRGAPAELCLREELLLQRADLVFTGGVSLYEAKRARHPRVYPFPSSVEAAHFARARAALHGPADQDAIPHPRLGFYGVLDERLDIELLTAIADARPAWQIVLIGPLAKIAPEDIPQRSNIHLLGAKPYADLPAYLAGWDVALMPFALNEATRFISPTKTPEYLAAGRPVVSTAIADVVEPYGRRGLVRIAADALAFIAACEAALQEDTAARQPEIDAFLANMTWDRTYERMHHLLDATIAERRSLPAGVAAIGIPGLGVH